MADINGFYTLKGYQLLETDTLTPAMQDYLEMICRMLRSAEVVRMRDLADRLHVRPSSASKMTTHLKENGYVDFQKYGFIVTTAKGAEIGRYLLHRHDVLHRFLCLLNRSDNELEQVEKIEHFLNMQTIKNIEFLTLKMQKEKRV